MSWSVPLNDVKVPEQDVEAYIECLRLGWLTMGPRSKAFEEAFATYCDAPESVAVSSGTAALHLALAGLGVGPGDEVIVPALSFVAVAAAARYVGAVPVFCESLGVHDLNLDPADVEARITPRTRAVLAVDLMGHTVDCAALRDLCDRHGLLLVEDVAQALGARCEDGRPAGLAADAATFSLFAEQQLGVGEGGLVVSTDSGVLQKVRSLRSHAMTSVTWDRHRGHAESYDILDVGFNFRLDEPRAAFALSRLSRLDADVDRRREAARAYRERLRDIDGIGLPWSDADVERSSPLGFAIVLDDGAARDRVREQLAADGIESTWFPSITSFTEYADAAGTCPRAEELADRHLVLPLSASFGDAEVEQVVASLRRALESAAAYT